MLEKEKIPHKLGGFVTLLCIRINLTCIKKYSDIPKEVITSHNNIPSLRAYENKQFPKLKNYLILGKRKTHKYEHLL